MTHALAHLAQIITIGATNPMLDVRLRYVRWRGDVVTAEWCTAAVNNVLGAVTEAANHAEQAHEGLMLCIDCVPKVQSILPGDQWRLDRVKRAGQQVVVTMATSLHGQPLWAWLACNQTIIVLIREPPQPISVTRHMLAGGNVALCFSRLCE